jgi:hypothetical protein
MLKRITLWKTESSLFVGSGSVTEETIIFLKKFMVPSFSLTKRDSPLGCFSQQKKRCQLLSVQIKHEHFSTDLSTFLEFFCLLLWMEKGLIHSEVQNWLDIHQLWTIWPNLKEHGLDTLPSIQLLKPE